MTSKRIMLAAIILAAATLASGTAGLAQGYYGGPYGQGYYDYAPGWGGGLYGYGGVGPFNYGPAVPNVVRGGPGPRVQAGSGMGIGAVR